MTSLNIYIHIACTPDSHWSNYVKHDYFCSRISSRTSFGKNNTHTHTSWQQVMYSMGKNMAFFKNEVRTGIWKVLTKMPLCPKNLHSDKFLHNIFIFFVQNADIFLLIYPPDTKHTHTTHWIPQKYAHTWFTSKQQQHPHPPPPKNNKQTNKQT